MGEALKTTARGLVRTPSFTLTVVLTIAAAIAINTAVFSVVHAVLLAPLPYSEPQRLVAVWELVDGEGGENRRPTPASYTAWRQRDRAFAGIAAFGRDLAVLVGAGDPVSLQGSRVSDNYFEVLGIPPSLGRTFRPEDGLPESAPVVILSDTLWRQRFGADPRILGRTIVLDGTSRTVVGVVRARFLPVGAVATGRFEFGVRPEFWTPAPLRGAAAAARNESHVLGVIARLAPGVDLRRASSETALLQQARRHEGSAGRSIGARLRPLADEAEGAVRPVLVLLWAAVFFVLVIAFANVASVQLARAEARRRELAIRTALGASRARLVRQLVAESLALALAGGALGLLLATWVLPLLLRLAPEGVPRLHEVTIDPATAAFGLFLAAAAGMLTGLVPALALTSATSRNALRDADRSPSAAPGTRRTLGWLVAAEIGVASLLVVDAGLLAKSFRNLVGVDLGFRHRSVLVVPFSLPKAAYGTAARVAAFQDALLARIRASTGVLSAALAYNHPLEAQWSGLPRVAGRPVLAGTPEPALWFRSVSDGYFATTGETLRAGRDFEPHDDARHPGVAIVNEAFARRMFPGASAIGQRLITRDATYWWGPGLPEEFEIVGVSGDVRFLGRDKPAEPAYFLPARQFPIPDMKLLVRGDDPLALLPLVRAAFRDIDPNLPIGAPTTIAALADASVAQPRFALRLMAGFGGAALALAALGIYGLLTFVVALRTREIGVRMALGAGRIAIVRLVLAEAAPLTAAGAVGGALASLLGAPLLRHVLFGVSASDPAALFSAPLALAFVGFAAAYFPARRAAGVDPMVAMRNE